LAGRERDHKITSPLISSPTLIAHLAHRAGFVYDYANAERTALHSANQLLLEVNMRAIIDEDSCISCELCVEACPEVFTMHDKAQVIADPVPTAVEADCRAAAEGCPVSAITIEE
jgi:ferredoxin